jgi:hypothetical protein
MGKILRRRFGKLAKKKKEEKIQEEGHCYVCKEYDSKLIGRPCRFRDYPDFQNMCLSYSINNKLAYAYRGK